MIHFLFKISITLILTFFLFTFIDKTLILNNLQSLNFFQFISYLFLIIFSFFLLYLRFSSLVNCGFKKKFTFKDKIDIFGSSLALSYLPIPGAQEFYKYYNISKFNKNKELSVYLVVIERILGFLASVSIILVLIFLILIKIIFNAYDLYQSIFYLTLIISFCAILFYFASKIVNFIPYLSYVFQYIKLNILNFRIFVVKVFLFSIFIQIISISSSLYAISFFSNIENFLLLLIYLQLASLIIALPISFFGIGLRDVIYATVFTSQLNFNSSDIASSAIIINFFILSIILINLFFLLILRKNFWFAKKGNK